MSFCSADTLTYEDKRSCNSHAATITAWRAESIQRSATSCDPEGRSGALVNAYLIVPTDAVSVDAPCRNRALPCRSDAGLFRDAVRPAGQLLII